MRTIVMLVMAAFLLGTAVDARALEASPANPAAGAEVQPEKVEKKVRKKPRRGRQARRTTQQQAAPAEEVK